MNVPAGKRNYQIEQKHIFLEENVHGTGILISLRRIFIFFFMLPLCVLTGPGRAPDLFSSMGSAWPARNKSQSPEGKWTKVLVPFGASVKFGLSLSLWAVVLVNNSAAMCRIRHVGGGFWISELRSWNAVLFRVIASWNESLWKCIQYLRKQQIKAFCVIWNVCSKIETYRARIIRR